MFQHFTCSWTWNNLILATEGGTEHLSWTLLWLVDHVIKYILLKRHIFQILMTIGCKECNEYWFNCIPWIWPRLDFKLFGVTKCTTLAPIAYTWLQNSRKTMNETVELPFSEQAIPSALPILFTSCIKTYFQLHSYTWLMFPTPALGWGQWFEVEHLPLPFWWIRDCLEMNVNNLISGKLRSIR